MLECAGTSRTVGKELLLQLAKVRVVHFRMEQNGRIIRLAMELQKRRGCVGRIFGQSEFRHQEPKQLSIVGCVFDENKSTDENVVVIQSE